MWCAVSTPATFEYSPCTSRVYTMNSVNSPRISLIAVREQPLRAVLDRDARVARDLASACAR